MVSGSADTPTQPHELAGRGPEIVGV